MAIITPPRDSMAPENNDWLEYHSANTKGYSGTRYRTCGPKFTLSRGEDLGASFYAEYHVAIRLVERHDAY